MKQSKSAAGSNLIPATIALLMLAGLPALVYLSLYLALAPSSPPPLPDPSEVQPPELVSLPVQAMPHPFIIPVWKNDRSPLLRSLANDAIEHGGWVDSDYTTSTAVSLVVPDAYLPRLAPLMTPRTADKLDPPYRRWVQGQRPQATSTGPMTQVTFKVQMPWESN